MTDAEALHPRLDRIQRLALLGALTGAALCILGFFVSRQQFFLSYLYAYIFCLGIPLGCIAVLMLQHLTGGAWGLVIRRTLESGSRLLPLMAILFIPLAFGIHHLYAWSHHPEHGLKGRYLTTSGFLLRAVLYFAIWIILAFFLNRWSRDEDRGADPRILRKFQLISGGGLAVYGLTVTFASIDWIMSLDPHWYSTIWGFTFIVGQVLSALAICITVLALLRERRPFAGVLNQGHFHDLGNLLMAFVMLWAYMSFSQFLIIWMGNIAEESPYYVYRLQRGWRWLALFIILFHFAVPFILLLNRNTKRNPQILARVAVGILLMRLLDLLWVVIPMHAQGKAHVMVPMPIGHVAASLSDSHAAPHPVPPEPKPGHGATKLVSRMIELPRMNRHGLWLNIAAPLGLGGIFVSAFISQLRRRPLVPLNDPRLLEVNDHV